MNLAKAALYIEYIAFLLRKEQNMRLKQPDARPTEAQNGPQEPSGAATDQKPAQEAPEKPKAKPRRPSTALQAAAHVERILDELKHEERYRVLGWINSRYAQRPPPVEPTPQGTFSGLQEPQL